MKPTWSGWDEVIAAQNANVKSHSDCLYKGTWDDDDIPWEPWHDFPWNTCAPDVRVDAELTITERIASSNRFLWEPVPEESTIWNPVDYPN